MKGIVTIGGLTKDIDDETLQELSSYLNKFRGRFTRAVKECVNMTTVVDRLVTTGIVKKRFVRGLHLTGPIARSIDNLPIDQRLKHPYGYYSELKDLLEPITDTDGDVLARFNVKQLEVLKSIKIIQHMIENLAEGYYHLNIQSIPDGYATSIVEAARGQNFQFIYIKNGKIDRYKVRTASYCNWQAIQHAVLGNIVPDFPLINKSFNLSYAGTDL